MALSRISSEYVMIYNISSSFSACFVNTCVHVHAHVCTCTCLYVCTCSCICVCMLLCVYMYIFLCVCMFLCVHVRVPVYVHVETREQPQLPFFESCPSWFLLFFGWLFLLFVLFFFEAGPVTNPELSK